MVRRNRSTRSGGILPPDDPGPAKSATTRPSAPDGAGDRPAGPLMGPAVTRADCDAGPRARALRRSRAVLVPARPERQLRARAATRGQGPDRPACALLHRPPPGHRAAVRAGGAARRRRIRLARHGRLTARRTRRPGGDSTSMRSGRDLRAVLRPAKGMSPPRTWWSGQLGPGVGLPRPKRLGREARAHVGVHSTLPAGLALVDQPFEFGARDSDAAADPDRSEVPLIDPVPHGLGVQLEDPGDLVDREQRVGGRGWVRHGRATLAWRRAPATASCRTATGCTGRAPGAVGRGRRRGPHRGTSVRADRLRG